MNVTKYVVPDAIVQGSIPRTEVIQIDVKAAVKM